MKKSEIALIEKKIAKYERWASEKSVEAALSINNAKETNYRRDLMRCFKVSAWTLRDMLNDLLNAEREQINNGQARRTMADT